MYPGGKIETFTGKLESESMPLLQPLVGLLSPRTVRHAGPASMLRILRKPFLEP